MYFEDYYVGQVFDDIEPMVYTKEELIRAGKNWDPRDIHIYEKNPYYDTIISPGFYSLMTCWGQWVKTGIDRDGIIAGFGIREALWKKPIYADTKYKIKIEIVGKQVRKEGRNGLVAYKMTVTDPSGEVCLECTPLALVRFKNSK
ncbi:MAG: dehydratase [Peptoniphilaceae bacterium]|nr:dehydratase [Peptoniphilaceae bacterium]MDY6018274.1 dehydratase [Anaerococcus sp.]